MTKNTGPRTEPWGTPQTQLHMEDKLFYLTWILQDDRWNQNQSTSVCHYTNLPQFQARQTQWPIHKMGKLLLDPQLPNTASAASRNRRCLCTAATEKTQCVTVPPKNASCHCHHKFIGGHIILQNRCRESMCELLYHSGCAARNLSTCWAAKQVCKSCLKLKVTPIIFGEHNGHLAEQSAASIYGNTGKIYGKQPHRKQQNPGINPKRENNAIQGLIPRLNNQIPKSWY